MATGKELGCPLCTPDEECPGQHELGEVGPLEARIAQLEEVLTYIRDWTGARGVHYRMWGIPCPYADIYERASAALGKRHG